jgi:hypothetical protein
MESITNPILEILAPSLECTERDSRPIMVMTCGCAGRTAFPSRDDYSLHQDLERPLLQKRSSTSILSSPDYPSTSYSSLSTGYVVSTILNPSTKNIFMVPTTNSGQGSRHLPVISKTLYWRGHFGQRKTAIPTKMLSKPLVQDQCLCI